MQSIMSNTGRLVIQWTANPFDVLVSRATDFGKIPQNNGHYAV